MDNDIKKAIEENKFWRTFIKEQKCWTPKVDAVGKLAYANGYNKAKKELQESSRWRKVSEELPEMGEKVLLKIEGNSSVAFGLLRGDNDYSVFYCPEDDEFIPLYEIDEWKPIN